IERLRALGAEAEIVACDAADRDALAALLAGIPKDHPLTAVVHAAGVLDDGLLGAITPEQLSTVLRPKVDGAWNLHEATRGTDLPASVWSSPFPGIQGTAGQAASAAANAFLDALAEQRAAAGQPGLSLAWGLWEPDSAMTGGLAQDDRARLARTGMLPLSARL